MGKHSPQKDGGFGSGKRGSRRPIRRRTPQTIASGAELSSASFRRGKLARERMSDPRERKQGALEAAPERLKAERDRRSRRARRVALVAAGALAVLFVTAAVGVFAWANHLENTMQKTVYRKEKLDVDVKKAEPQKPFNLLLLGYDKRPKDAVYRSDTIILARVDPVTKQVWMLSIPRDAKVQVPGHGTRKINEAFSLGQEQLAIETVEQFTGLPVNHFMGINFKGFHKAVDAMGGVWVDVEVAINDREADASPGKRASRIDPGYQKLDGEHALTYVRTRHTFADQDFGRMRNQQTFFLAVADQIAEKTSVARLPRIVAAIAPYISTDMSLFQMMRTAQALKGAGSKRVYTETIPGQWRSPFVVVDAAQMEKLLAKLEAGEPFKTPKPSEEATGTVGAVQASQGSTVAPSKVRVTVRNGAGIAGCAKQASSVLKAQGFKVVEVGNAGQFVYDKTLVVHKDDPDIAALVARALPPGAKLVPSRGMYAFDGDILVVVGKDWDVAKVPVTPVTSN